MCHRITTNILLTNGVKSPKATNPPKNVTEFNEFLTRYNILGIRVTPKSFPNLDLHLE